MSGLDTQTGLPAERCLHSDSGSTGEYSGGLPEDDVGVPVWLYRDALSAGRRLPGLYIHQHSHSELVYVCVYVSVGEQLLLLARGGGRGDGVWETKSQVSAMGDIVERKFGITALHFTDTLIVKMIQLTSWQLQELPHPSAIMALVVKLNNAL